MDVGKVPQALLERLLARVPINDPRVLLGPRVGEDAALIDMGDRVLVAKTDPITFATDLVGWYAIQVNANDVACMGAVPRWFLTTVLLPENAPEDLAETIFGQLTSACAELQITLIGGHSEITHGLHRPIVVGLMLGETSKGRAIRTGGARPGDALILTKGIALEGTSVLAREATRALEDSGMAPGTLERARGLLFQPGISVVREALIAAESCEVHSMHDPTEGGLATGLWELSAASGLGVAVEMEAVHTFPETRAVCAALGLDPMGLLASGALLIALTQDQAPDLIDALRAKGIRAEAIGYLREAGTGVQVSTAAALRDLESFPRDELARYMSEA